VYAPRYLPDSSPFSSLNIWVGLLMICDMLNMIFQVMPSHFNDIVDETAVYA
jgi:hypothetical protein